MFTYKSNVKSIDEFAKEAIDIRDHLNTEVIGEYNGQHIAICGGTTEEDITDAYKKLASEPTDNELKRNAEHYVDPTAYKAIKRADRDAAHEKVRKLTGCLKRVCELAGFDIVNRIELRDQETGEIWK